jgi:hypothetical protein
VPSKPASNTSTRCWHSLRSAKAIRGAIAAELADHTQQANRDRTIATSRIKQAESEREMSAHCAGAIPLEVLKKEMERITSDLAAAEKLLADTQTEAVAMQRLVDNALELAQHCAKLYGPARANERRMFNQGFFTRNLHR